ncbi:hypothetical protein MKW92_029168 [Papaver armeniacum]|nr:hypothetical protein MKW92_029168 [Papaver armeniacum]
MVKMGSSKDKSRSSTDELMKIHEKLLEAEKKAVQKRCAVKEYCELDSRMGKKVVCQENIKSLSLIYNKRSEIIKTIPNFWLTAFCSHYALGILLSEEDQKIFKFLESVDVEDTEVGTGVPGYMITLYFADNPYFENKTLSKKISYSSGGMDVCGSDIKWKGIPTGNQQESLAEKGKKRECADGEISFFTWFTDHDDYPDEVAMLIIEDLWPNAITYFVNGNLVTEEEYAIVEDCRLNLSCN